VYKILCKCDPGKYCNNFNYSSVNKFNYISKKLCRIANFENFINFVSDKNGRNRNQKKIIQYTGINIWMSYWEGRKRNKK
jgi:hypothetical protein